MEKRSFRQALVVGLLVVVCSVGSVAAESLQLDVPVASFCVGGTFPVTVTAGGATLPGTLTMTAGDAAAVSGELAIGAEIFTLTGKQKAKKGVLGVALKGVNATGAKISLKGTAVGAHLVGTISGKIGGAKLAAKSTFDADLTGALPFVVRCDIDVTIDPASGAVTGFGLAQVCGAFDGVSLAGSTNLPKAVAKGKKATGKLKITSSTFTWSGKGALTQSPEDGSLGFVVAWKGKSLGVGASGTDLRFATVIDGPSPGEIALPESIATRFNPLTLQNVVLTVSRATPSTNPLDFSFTQNGDPLSPGLTVDAQQGTLTLGQLDLVDGRNDIGVVGKDVTGLTLSSVVTIWAGPHDLVVAVRDSLDHPVAGATVELMLGDDQRVVSSGTSDANGDAPFSNITNRTVLVRAIGPAGASGIASGLGNAGTIVVTFLGFDAPSPIDNNDFATGDASGWSIGATATIVPHVEDAGPGTPLAARAPPFGSDVDLSLATLGEGTQTLSRTFATKPNTVAVTLRYRFITEEIPGGYFGTKYNDAFSVSVRSQNGGGQASDVNTMNGLGLAEFDGGGATAWKEITLPVTSTGDLVQVDVTVANVADEFFDSAVIVDKVSEVTVDLVVANASRVLLETNRFEITVNPPGGASNFKIEIRRAGTTAWFTLGTQQVVSDKQRVAGTFKLRGRATIAGKEQITSEKDLQVQFPAFGDIVANGAVIAMTDAAFASTKAATTPASRREEGFFILLDTNTGAEKYGKSPTVVGPSAGPTQQGAVDFDKPADNPAAPTPIQSAIYAVASFHTHTPNVFRPVARPVGPTAVDRNSDTNVDHVTGIVYDYVGVNGLVPAQHPLNSPAKLYQSGPDRRPTP